MYAIALDVGGANVKVADSNGRAVTRPFAIWREPDRLTAVLAELLEPFDPADVLAVTTTAELADCFRTKAEGVDHVLAACEAVAGGRPVAVWQTGAEFVSTAVAREIPLLVAAANWHALATWLGRLVPAGPALLVDMGSTTTDLVPLENGVPVPRGMTDVERLVAGELLYLGVRRTPVFHVSTHVPFRNGRCPLVPELFATMHDVSLVLGEVSEDSADHDTANGRPATRAEALDRLARSVCCDRTEVGENELVEMASYLSESQTLVLAAALARVAAERSIEHVVISGSGSGVVARALADTSLGDRSRTLVADMFDAATASAACARAVAELAVERRADLV